jgi:hypothetical protein
LVYSITRERERERRMRRREGGKSLERKGEPGEGEIE